MIGTITLLIALATQIGFMVYQLVTKKRQTVLKHTIRITAFAVFFLLMLTRVYWWGFRWMGLTILLAVWAVLGAVFFIRKNKKVKCYKGFKVVLSCVSGCILLTFCILPGILFPQFKPVTPTGSYQIATKSITYVDRSRIDTYSKTEENRKLTAQFWYPDTNKNSDTFPLVIFSHGSFGYRGSNQSTFENLASNGYVVCSIDHSYHAFFSKHTDGSNTLVNMEFLNDATNIENGVYNEQITYDKTTDWLQLRTTDMNYILDQILQNTKDDNSESVYSLINTDKIGLFGHSLGGAAAAQLCRQRSDIDSVIVIDGTMIGEQLGLENGNRTFNKKAFPKPLLNIYNADHYKESHELGMAYNNFFASKNAVEAYDVVVKGSGHLNFTDLPLFSPVLAQMLGTGSVDSRYCIETMNQITLKFFNYALKDSGKLQLKTEY